MRATAFVAKNRVYHKRFDDSYTKVLLKDYQFECVNSADHVWFHLDRMEIEPYITGLIASSLVYLNVDQDDPTDGAIVYVTIDTHRDWLDELEFIKCIGQHKYYKYKED